ATTGRCSRSSSSCSPRPRPPSVSPSSSASTRPSRPSTWTQPPRCADDPQRRTEPIAAPYLALIPLLPLAGAVTLGLGGAALQRRLGEGPGGWVRLRTRRVV